jgi:sialate O-acetylesterase
MVLQQKKPIWVWGWADRGERVSVTLGSKTVRTTVRGDQWRVKLPKQKAGGPHTLVVQGRNRIEIQDVLIGEVWICSGQSNMAWDMSRSFEPEEEIANSRNPWIRLFTVPRVKAVDPLDDVESSWQPCLPETVKGFSAVGYYFGRDLQNALKVPVGLIHTSWGGSPAEVWMRWDLLAAHSDYRETLLEPWPARERKYEADLAAWKKETEELKEAGKKPARGQPRRPWRPAELYNGMIAPLIPYTVAGAIWYQGEANASRAFQYRHLFLNMIENWRADWGQGDFPFLAVQLAPWDKNRKRSPEEIAAVPVESDWAELREAQLLATQLLQDVGLAIITDVGDKDDIHPTKKEPVGARLSLLARDIAYGKKLVSSGPIFKKMKVKKERVILSFDHVGSGLEARGGRLRGFALCGEDQQFFWAQAEIDGDEVIVRHPLIREPVAVRYGWADYPIVNLFNREGLPASPFRTDDFPLTTAPRE